MLISWTVDLVLLRIMNILRILKVMKLIVSIYSTYDTTGGCSNGDNKTVCCYNFYLDKDLCLPCLPGYWGHNCSFICEPPGYGLSCGLSCAGSCNNTECHHEYGCLFTAAEVSTIPTISITELTRQHSSASLSLQLTSSSELPTIYEDKTMHIFSIILCGFVVSLVMLIIIIYEISRYRRLTEKFYQQRSSADPSDVILYEEISEIIPDRKQSNEAMPLCQGNDSKKYQRQHSVHLNVQCDTENNQDRISDSFENDNIEKKAVVKVETEIIDLSDDKVMTTEQILANTNVTKDSESTSCIAEGVDEDIDIYSTVRK